MKLYDLRVSSVVINTTLFTTETRRSTEPGDLAKSVFKKTQFNLYPILI
jgi:hypothetical protein